MALDLKGLFQKDGLLTKFISRKFGIALGTILMNHSSAPDSQVAFASQALVDALVGVAYLFIQGKADAAEKALPGAWKSLDQKIDESIQKALTKARGGPSEK